MAPQKRRLALDELASRVESEMLSLRQLLIPEAGSGINCRQKVAFFR